MKNNNIIKKYLNEILNADLENDIKQKLIMILEYYYYILNNSANTVSDISLDLKALEFRSLFSMWEVTIKVTSNIFIELNIRHIGRKNIFGINIFCERWEEVERQFNYLINLHKRKAKEENWKNIKEIQAFDI